MQYTNNNNVPLSLAVWLATDNYKYSDDPNTISATTLLHPLKAIVLARQNKDLEKSGDVFNLLPSRMGTSFHDSIEMAWLKDTLHITLKELGYGQEVIDRIVINPINETANPNIIPVYIERRETKKVGIYTITGQFDFVAMGALEDFKSTSVYTHIFGSNNDKYIQQGSIYRWLNPSIITEDQMSIRYIFTDWVAAKARSDKNYPQSKLLTKTLTLMSIQETDLFINRILNKITELMPKSQVELPACTPEELWQKDPVWKYYKDPSKMVKSTKNFDNQDDANNRYLKDGSTGLIKFFPGEVVKCRYCNVREICTQAQDYIKSGLLVI